MSFRIATFRISRLREIFLLSAVFVCLCPTSVSASCGDYVMVTGSRSNTARSNTGHAEANSTNFGNHSQDLFESVERRNGHRPVQVPCHGPNCSRRQSIPPLAPTSVLRLAVDHWALLPGSNLASSTPEITLFVVDPGTGFATSNNSRVYRPPR
jgi:hypothetical protein